MFLYTVLKISQDQLAVTEHKDKPSPDMKELAVYLTLWILSGNLFSRILSQRFKKSICQLLLVNYFSLQQTISVPFNSNSWKFKICLSLIKHLCCLVLPYSLTSRLMSHLNSGIYIFIHFLNCKSGDTRVYPGCSV